MLIKKHLLAATLLAGCLVVAGSSANATTFVKFYTDAGNTHGYGNAGDVFSGAGTLYASMTTPGSGATATPVTCPTTGSCSADNIQTTLTFNLPAALVLNVTASDANVAGVKPWDDLAPNFGGIGAGTGDTSGNDRIDQINGTNKLILTFASSVHLTGVATLFDGAHTPFGNGTPLTGGFLLNGVFVTFADANTNKLNLNGTIFTFQEVSTDTPQFYVSGLAYDTLGGGGQGSTPIPGALPLFASGGGVLGLLNWRRKRKAKATV
jgi:hypothetical protein